MNLGPLDPRRIALHALMRRGANRGSRRVQTVPEYLAQVAEHPEPTDPPAGLAEQLGLTVVSEQFGDTPGYHLRPEPRRPQAFVYLHGGSYIAQINAGQWKFAAELAARFPDRVVKSGGDLRDTLAGASGLIHATPTGMAKLPGLPLPAEYLHKELWVAEIVYFPLETELLKVAKALGCRTVSGGGMAVCQAVDALRIFTGLEPDAERMFAHFQSLLER